MLYRIMSTRSAISAKATTTATPTATQPAVTKGRPNILPFSCPTVFNPWTISYDSLCRSAKSCVECRERKNARMKRTPPKIAKTRPTKKKGSALLKQIWELVFDDFRTGVAILPNCGGRLTSVERWLEQS